MTNNSAHAEQGGQNDPLGFAPHSVESEVSTLGAILMNPEVLPQIATFLTADDFFILRHGWIFEAILFLLDHAQPIDIRTLGARLAAQERLEQIGGEDYLNYLPTTVPTALHGEVYAHLVARASVRRQLISTASDIAGLAHDETLDLPTVIDTAQDAVNRLEVPGAKNVALTWTQAAEQYRDFLDEIRQTNELPAIATPWPALNKKTGGYVQTTLTILAADTGKGKSLFLWQSAFKAAAAGHKVLFFSLEMAINQLVARRVTQDQGLSQFEQWVMTDEQYQSFLQWMDRSSKILGDNLRTLVVPDMSAPTILNQIRAYHRRGLCDIAFVDYLQLARMPNEQNRTLENEAVGRSLKGVALDLNIPVVTASQITMTPGQRVKDANLRWGGLKQDADNIWILDTDYEPADDANPNALPERIPAELFIQKNRNGVTSPPSVGLIWNRAKLSFESPAGTEPDPMPDRVQQHLPIVASQLEVMLESAFGKPKAR
jgi:replicative DNA helicase